MEKISEDGGSGRDDIFRTIINEHLSSILSFPEILIGNGFEGIRYKFNKTIMAAHNDFLEILYSYSFIGLFLMLKLYHIVYKRFISFKKENSYLAIPILMVLFLLLLYSSLANIFYFFYYSIPLFIFIGTIEGYYKYQKCNNSIKQ